MGVGVRVLGLLLGVWSLALGNYRPDKGRSIVGVEGYHDGLNEKELDCLRVDMKNYMDTIAHNGG